MLHLICQFVKYHRIIDERAYMHFKTIVMYIHVALILHEGQP